MSDCKWTAGPWLMDTNDESTSIKDEKGKFIVAGEYDGYMTPFDCRHNPEESVANARLISAAPIMAEFIMRLIDNSQLELGLREEAKAIIAKARGETE